ncbi:class I SAM-dependent methyltransferase [Roseococcus sp. YIM B11640]|uniref:class I SAM-dependent methyltransferase n=1 Tax=Roseococcus sp. YIM B11640 TaxID=3133973 RepID=UPI003C7E78DE
MDKMETLDEIGLRCGTDKASNRHGYLNFYDMMLRDLREKPVKLLEIGIYKGASLQMWSDYFANGTITGADVRAGIETLETDRIKPVHADQNNIIQLTELCMTRGPFDVIVDDGSHRWDHQMTSLVTLLPFVKPGGYYILEDLHTSDAASAEGYRGLATISPVEYLADLSKRLCLTRSVGKANTEADRFLRAFMMDLEFICWHTSTVVMRRKEIRAKATAPTSAEEPPVAAE